MGWLGLVVPCGGIAAVCSRHDSSPFVSTAESCHACRDGRPSRAAPARPLGHMVIAPPAAVTMSLSCASRRPPVGCRIEPRSRVDAPYARSPSGTRCQVPVLALAQAAIAAVLGPSASARRRRHDVLYLSRPGQSSSFWSIDEFTTHHWVSVQHEPRRYPLGGSNV